MKLGQIFNEFITVVKDDKNYTIGLLNTDGKVLFSSDPSKISQRFRLDCFSESDRLYPIQVKNQDFGYLWVHSLERGGEMVGNLLAQSLKNRLTYELADELLQMNTSLEHQLIQLLINKEKFDFEEIIDLMQELKIDTKAPKVSILIINPQGFAEESLTRLKYRMENRGSFQSRIDHQSILLFKTVSPEIKPDHMQLHLAEFISELQDWGLTDCYFYVGMLQGNPRLYYKSYESCLWLKHNIQMKLDKPLFFADHIFDYFISKWISDEELQAFDYYRKSSRQLTNTGEMIKIAEQLFRNDYNITQTAEALFLHKNTLVYKIKKYEEVFGLDIRSSFQDKIVFYLIASLLKVDKKRKEAGGQS